MKKLTYDFLQTMREDGTPILLSKTIVWSEENETIARKEAYNGAYCIEDDGQPEQDVLTQEQRIAELEEALDMLLSGVTA